ncbi:MAG: transglutaminase domain-containing protein [Lachnospiraceae bacterium]
MIKKILITILTIISLFIAMMFYGIFNPDFALEIATKLFPDRYNTTSIDVEEEISSEIQEEQSEEIETQIEIPKQSEESIVKQSEVTQVFDEIETPLKSISGKNGYISITEQSNQVSDKENEEIQKTKDYGETGSSLTFDTEMYPYYGMLSEAGQTLYKQIYSNANILKKTFNPIVDVDKDHVKNVFMAVFNDHPELFWLYTSYSSKYSKPGICIEITLTYYDFGSVFESEKTKFNQVINTIVDGAKTKSTDFEKEQYVHDALINRITYNLQAPLNQSAYSAIVNGSTVCAGYARAFQLIMQKLEIPTYYCTGYAGERHAWNIVKLEGEYYNVDLTWDDSDPFTYDYFNRTDQDFIDTHTRQDLSVNLPEAKGTKYRNLVGNISNEILKEKVSTIEEYYTKCLSLALVQKEKDSISFEVIIGDNILEDVKKAYQDNAYQNGYVNRLMDEIEADSLSVNIESENLGSGYYKLYHTIRK